MTKKYVEFSLDEIREINFAVSCHLQDKENISPTAKKRLESIFNKTSNTLKGQQELQATRGF